MPGPHAQVRRRPSGSVRLATSAWPSGQQVGGSLMGSVSVPAREVVYPDGRHELRDVGDLAESPLWNEDLAPVPIQKRTWTTYNYAALWIGMAHNIPTYLLASSLIALGMAWYQAILTIALAKLIVLIP